MASAVSRAIRARETPDVLPAPHHRQARPRRRHHRQPRGHPGDFAINFGETATIVLTPNQIVDAVAQLQAAIDEHMKLRPVAAA